VVAGGSVHCVSPFGTIEHRAETDFLNSIVGVCFPASVFGEEDNTGGAVLETDKRVFPITDVISEPDVENCISKVVGVKVKHEGIDDNRRFLHEDENGGSG